ncbi:ferredoxin [Micromonospora sp. WMMD723]|uniref:ferredoxin n=1 Tax=unclassified Micromonospora TaxID=2617518 RepID=UPI003B938DFC
MRISIDRDSCIGSGQCILIAPGVFAQDEVGISYLLPAGENGAESPSASEAETGCPVRAITVHQD